MTTLHNRLIGIGIAVAMLCLRAAAAPADMGATPVPFDAEHWQLDSEAKFVTFEGRPALVGSGFVKGVELRRGTVEADIWTTGEINFAGFMFHALSFRDMEWVFVRTHKTNGIIPDAVQYAPSFHGSVCWQLMPDGLAAASVPPRGWVHLKLDIEDDAARFFVGDMSKPALVVKDLRRDNQSGLIGLRSLAKPSVYLSNFTYRRDDSKVPAETEHQPIAPDVIAEWQLSPAYSISGAADVPTAYPLREPKDVRGWITPAIDPNGLINISRVYESGASSSKDALPAKWAMLRTVITAKSARRVKMNFGYSDAVTIFVNGKPVFSGNNAYMLRNRADGEWISFADAVFLDLKKGRNELIVAVAEQFGGWGFQAKLDDREGLQIGAASRGE